MHAGGTNQTTSTQTLQPPNALALSPTTTQLAFIPHNNEPPNLHTQNYATSNKPSRTLKLASLPSTPSVHTSNNQKEKSVAKKNDISSKHLS
jgi:hypothetical protein